MGTEATGGKPSALKHGLSSQWLFETIEDQAAELAVELIGSSPRGPRLLEAAQAAAEAILHLRHIRSMKALALNEAEPGRPTVVDIDQYFKSLTAAAFGGRDGRSGGGERIGDGHDLALLDFMEQSGTLLRRLDDYERRALSKRSKAIRELDLMRIDIERAASRDV